LTIMLLISVFPANIYLYLSDEAREIMNITRKQALTRMPFQIPLILIAFWHSKETCSKKISIMCSIIFIPTIIYFILI